MRRTAQQMVQKQLRVLGRVPEELRISSVPHSGSGVFRPAYPAPDITRARAVIPVPPGAYDPR